MRKRKSEKAGGNYETDGNFIFFSTHFRNCIHGFKTEGFTDGERKECPQKKPDCISAHAQCPCKLACL